MKMEIEVIKKTQSERALEMIISVVQTGATQATFTNRIQEFEETASGNGYKIRKMDTQSKKTLNIKIPNTKQKRILKNCKDKRPSNI